MCCKIISTENYLLVFGGGNINVQKEALQDIWRLNLITRRWTLLKDVTNLPHCMNSYSRKSFYAYIYLEI